MAIHATLDEFEARTAATLRAMADARLDALLLFKPESHYWLTGYDTFGYCFFQGLVLRADGGLALLTRSADLRQAGHTSIIEDVRVWRDAADALPIVDFVALLADLGLSGKRLGVEWRSQGLSGADGIALRDALEGFATAIDASTLVGELRLVKSPAELDHVRRAGDLADAAYAAARGIVAPGADEGAVLAAMHNAVFAAGGDYPANPFIVNSGPDALLCRYKTGRRRLDADDQLTLEWAGVWRHYHAAAMRTLIVGPPSDLHQRYFAAAIGALEACEAALRAGASMGDVFAAHARALDRRGLGEHRLNACGYALGATYAPSWMDHPFMFYAGNPTIMRPNMVFFIHIIIADSASGTAMSLGRTSIVRDGGPERVNGRRLAETIAG